jgi:NADH-ubiquinone oxidoreductase chain 5
MFSSVTIICLPIYYKNLTLFVCLFGAFSGYLMSNISLFFNYKSLSYYLITFFAGSIWFIPVISTLGVIKFPLNLGFKVLKSFDQG